MKLQKSFQNTNYPLYYLPKFSYSFMFPMDKETELINLGKRIRAIRKEKGMTQTELAHSIGKDQQSIQMIENGKFNPTYYYLKELAEGLKVSPKDFFD